MVNCTLCQMGTASPFVTPGDERVYHHCSNCEVITVHSSFFPSFEQERERYRQHNNGVEHDGYVAFLNRAVSPTLKYLDTEMVGLDYGCGPKPTLSIILKRHSIECENYDPVFDFHGSRTRYDFIFATECFEHFFSPRSEMENISTLLVPGGTLTIMTERWEDVTQFATWYYKRDPTHVAFYHSRSFEYICDEFKFELLYTDDKRVVILRKQ